MPAKKQRRIPNTKADADTAKINEHPAVVGMENELAEAKTFLAKFDKTRELLDKRVDLEKVAEDLRLRDLGERGRGAIKKTALGKELDALDEKKLVEEANINILPKSIETKKAELQKHLLLVEGADAQAEALNTSIREMLVAAQQMLKHAAKAEKIRTDLNGLREKVVRSWLISWDTLPGADLAIGMKAGVQELIRVVAEGEKKLKDILTRKAGRFTKEDVLTSAEIKCHEYQLQLSRAGKSYRKTAEGKSLWAKINNLSVAISESGDKHYKDPGQAELMRVAQDSLDAFYGLAAKHCGLTIERDWFPQIS